MTIGTCDTMEELLQAHVDGEVTPAERESVDQHLVLCGACRDARVDLVTLGGRLRELLSLREQVDVRVDVPGVAASVAGAEPARTAARPGGPRMIGGYRLEGEIARGGMGTVFRAVQLSMDRPVALKVLAARLVESEEFVARFLREARVAAGLSHPNLVSIYDVGRDGDQLYYSMELIAGEDVEQRLQREGHFPPRRAVEVALGVAEALAAANAAGIVHRDIKPANILITTDGGVKLTDLGLAKALEGSKDATLTVNKRVIGSPNYMSPEQAGDLRAATHRSDIYSLGATLLHMITGQTPFAGGAPLEVIARVLRDPPPIPDVLPGGEPLDDDLRDLLARALEKDPAARQADATRLVGELRGWLARPATTPVVRRKTGRAAKGASSDSNLRMAPRASGRATRMGSDTGRVRRPGAPFGGLAIAAGVLVAIGVAVMAGKSNKDRGQQAVAPEPTPSAPTPPRPTPPRPTPPRPTPPAQPETPKADPAAAAALAELVAWGKAEARPAVETWRRSSDIAARWPDDPAAREAEAVRDRAAGELKTELAATKARADVLDQERRWHDAAEVYRGHLAALGGDDAPTALDAQLAVRSLEAQIAVRLGGDLELVGDLVKRGETGRAAEVVALALAYGGPQAEAQLRTRLPAGGAIVDRPADPAPGGDPARAREALAEARRRAGAGDIAGARAALAGVQVPAELKADHDQVLASLRAREALAEARRRAETGDIAGAREAMKGVDIPPDLKADVDTLMAFLDRGRDRPGNGSPANGAEDAPLVALLAAAFRGKTELLEDGRARIVYEFETPAEGEDWVAAPAAAGPEARLQEMLDGAAVRGPDGVDAPWTVDKKRLVGFGWSRRRFVAPLATDLPITIEVEARGNQNLLVGLAAPRWTTFAGVNYVLDLNVARMYPGGRRGNDEVSKFFGKLEDVVNRTRERGPSAVIAREGEVLLSGMEEAFVQDQNRRVLSKAEFALEVGPGEGGEGRTAALRIGKKTERVAFDHEAERVEVELLPLGSAGVAYDTITITGRIDPAFVERLRAAAREVGVEPAALRARLDADRRGAAEREADRRAEDRQRREREERERREREERERREREERERQGEKR